MKKLLSILLVLAICFVSVSVSAFAVDNESVVIDNGYSGLLDWTLYSDGTLRFSSDYTWTPPMNDYSETNLPPWHEYNDKIKEVVFECDISKISDYAFYKCSALEKVTFSPNITDLSVGAYAFYDCTSLETMFLFCYTSSGAEIGEYAFAWCSSLKEISIPSGVSIGKYAFKNCSDLKTVYFYGNDINNYTFSAESNSFSGVEAQVLYPYKGVLGYDIPNNNYGGTLTWEAVNYGPCGPNATWYYDTDENTLTISGEGNIVYRATGDRMPWGNFYKEIVNITVSNGIDWIPRYAFEFCKNVETVELPTTLKYFCTNAFNDCAKLNNILLPDSIEVFGYTQFNRCDSLTDLYYLGTEEEWNKIEGSADVSKSSGTALNIHFLVDISNAPTCMQGGEETYYQFDKTDVYSDLYDINKNVISEPVLIPAVDHSYTEYTPNGDATCNSYGTKTAFCNYGCGNSKTITGDEFGEHTYTSEITTPATHLIEGVKSFNCECGDSYTEPIAKLEGHTYTSEVTTPATHLTEGVETFICACGDSYTEAITKLEEHTYTSEITKEPTHLEEGETTYTCECDDTYTEPIAKLEDHTYTSEITTAPTHLTEGVKTFTCECGDTYTEAITKLEGHTYTSEVTKEPTHLEEGETTYTCECADTYKELIAKLTEHTYEKVVTVPTCTAQGYTTYICECGNSYVSDYVGVSEHSYSSTVSRPATHLAEGIRIYTCSSCGDTYTENIAKTREHSYFVSNVIAPTCEKEGYTVYSCECGDSYDGDKVSAKGHDYKGDTCKNCGETKVDNCSCNCHKSGFMGFIWKIMNFFNKLFKINKTCACGIAHY